MFRKYEYFYFIALCMAINTGITLTYEAKQHDIIDVDNRNAFSIFFHDLYSNMKHLSIRKLTMEDINFKEESKLKFHNITQIRRQEDLIIVDCDVDKQLQSTILLGCSNINGYIVTDKANTHKFTITFCAKAGIKMQSNFIDEVAIQFPYPDPMIRITPDANETASILSIRVLPLLRSQILDHLFAQVKKDELLSYYSTLKNYCFHSQADVTKQYYLINQTHLIRQTESEPHYNFTVNWIKIKNLRLNFFVTFNHDLLEPHEEVFIFTFSSERDFEVTFSGYYDSDEGSKASVEYKAKLSGVIIQGHSKLGSREVTARANIRVLNGDENADIDSKKQQYVTKNLAGIICDDLSSLVSQSYVKV